MKKFSKLLLVVLAVALLATTVFSTLGSAANNSENEKALVDAATALGITRKVEDFTGEEILIKDNIIPGEAYETTANLNSTDWISRETATNKYGMLSTEDSSSGNRYVRLAFDKGYAAPANGTNRSNIFAEDRHAFADVSYLVYEWDMTTETQYPTEFGAFFYNATSGTTQRDRQPIFLTNEAGDKIVVGDSEIALGAAGTWNHFTVVISVIKTGSAFTDSLGTVYMNGQKIADFKPVKSSNAKHGLALVLGYFNQEREALHDNATLCVDNIVATAIPVDYKADAANDKLAPLFASDNPVTDLNLIGSGEIVYNASYQVPTEPKAGVVTANGERVFFESFAEAYTAYKASGGQWIEIYENAEGEIDSSVVIKLPAGVTFTDTTADGEDKFPCLEATAADGSLYKSYTKSTATLNVRFFGGRKGTSDAELAQLEVPVAVGTILTVPENYAPIQFSENPDDRSKVYEATDAVEVYVNDVLQSEMPLIRENMLDAAVVDVYPVYELREVAFELVAMVDGEQELQYFTQSDALSGAVKNAPDGALITLRKNTGVMSRIVVDGKTLSIDLAGKALYQAGASAFNIFEVKNATLNLYSSVAGGVIYCGKDAAAETLITVVGDKTSTVRVGFADDAAKDAYAGNLAVHTSTAVKVSAQANVTLYAMDIKVVNSATVTNGIVELNSAKCKDTTVTLENVLVYNSYKENNVIAYSTPGANNTVNIKNTVIYAPAKAEADGKGFVNVVGAFDNADTQKVVLNRVSYFGTLSGTSVGDDGAVVLTIDGVVQATALDKATLAVAADTLYINDNTKVDAATIKYVAGGAYANSVNQVSGSAIPALCEYIAVGQSVEDFCEVSWVFFDGEGIVKELWVRGVVPEYRSTIPVSPENITYTFEDVVIETIAADATTMNVEAKEVAVLDRLGLQQNIAIIAGMDFKIHIPVNVPVVSVVVGETTILKENMTLSEDGNYYIASLGEFTIRNIATAEFSFSLNLKTARSTELVVSSVANVLDYFKAVYEDETLKIVEQRMVTAFLRYVQSAGNYLGVNTDAVGELVAGKAANYYLIEGLVETGVLRSAVSGVRMSLVEVPAFVFYLRETFSGTLTVGGTEYTIVNGVANEKNYILYTPASYAELGNVINFNISGTLAGETVEGTGAFALTNYLMGVREELGSTPNYVLDLYQFYAVAEIVEEMRAEEEMPY
ncbi:MAG: hypothetical protein IKC72_06730 [Clostridia bacterium]|nr:hypothetical protein [Clostridia bacterium]